MGGCVPGGGGEMLEEHSAKYISIYMCEMFTRLIMIYLFIYIGHAAV